MVKEEECPILKAKGFREEGIAIIKETWLEKMDLISLKRLAKLMKQQGLRP